MLKNAFEYKPEAIYVEYQMKEDSVSVKNYAAKFYVGSDSLNKMLVFDLAAIRAIPIKGYQRPFERRS